MVIQNMFVEDINRKINGVVKVDEDENKVLEQELNEYVITRELKRHFADFFNTYAEAFDEPTADTGVWISGFFGSGKSHFLKMLSYLLENKEVNGVRTVECFRKKFEDDPGTFMQVDRATKGETETILFNIDYEGSINKDKTAVLRVFAKVFYNHLGFFGSNLKVAMLEQYITQQGKMDEFCRLVEEKKGKPWAEVRKAFAFNGKVIKPALAEALDISEEDANNWFNDKSATELSVSQLVDDINAYVSTKPANFRLLFMVDEAGQYVGTDTDMLLNLQSLVEKIGSECRGKVWVVCTGQEAIDEIIKVRADEFSRIQARFKTRLSLSSSSVDEVIQKRILKKTPEAEKTLDAVYEQENSGMRNLFSFTNAMPDIKGFSGPAQFAEDFPFVPYQFLIMQKIFVEIRKHGNAGKHFSGGERSMLSGFQEAAQKVEKQNEFALVPLFRFYDTVHSFLDGSIRNVIDRCSKAVENHDGLEPMDVDVLKLLYLIRYVNEDIPANLDNLVILMADDIRLEKVAMREKLRGSLDRLIGQNYIGRTGDTYNFLTDEEQDIQKEINLTQVDTGAIVGDIAKIIFGIIYDVKKFRYGKCDFPFDQMVDNTMYGIATGGMRLRFLTAASDATEKTEFRLMNSSKGSEAIVVLGDTPYYESLEASMKIRKYVKQRNVSQMPKSAQDIIRGQQEEATKYEAEASKALVEAIENAKFYADGEHLDIKSGNAKAKIDQTMEYLVSHVYSKLDLIGKNADTDAEIMAVLSGADVVFAEADPNRDAEAAVEEYLEMQAMKHLPTSMADVQSKFSSIPYGWKEIDIAYVVARLIVNQKVTIKYAGTTIQPDNAKLPDMLRKKSEVGKISISKRVVVSVDEVAGIKFKDKDGIQIMKDYMASGSFARGKEEKAASASMVFVGNINQSVDVLLKTSSLFDPFPPEMGTDTAFLDRLHCYIPGWEIPKFRPEHFTNDYGFITDYLAEFIRELRKEQYGDALDKYFRLGKNLNQRDTIAVRKIVGGYVKLLYPDGEFTKEQLEEILVFALEMRRRVKEQLKKLGGMEFYDVNFSYIDLDTFEEKFVSVPEQGGGKLIPDGMCNPGQIYTVSRGKSGMIGVFRLESQMLPGSGKFERTGLGSDRDCKESTNTAFNFLKANGKRISGGISTASKDYIINYQDLQGIGMTGKLALPTLIALCSIALGRPTVSTLAVLGEISISGTILKVDELANSLQVCLDSGAKKVLLPITSAADLGTVPPELVGSFNLIFYSSAEDAVFKALGVE